MLLQRIFQHIVANDWYHLYEILRHIVIIINADTAVSIVYYNIKSALTDLHNGVNHKGIRIYKHMQLQMDFASL